MDSEKVLKADIIVRAYCSLMQTPGEGNKK
jgi:hypothetical protein